MFILVNLIRAGEITLTHSSESFLDLQDQEKWSSNHRTSWPEFRISIMTQPIIPPRREVADYSPEERDRLRDAFLPAVSDHYRHCRLEGRWTIGYLCGILFTILFSSLPCSHYYISLTFFHYVIIPLTIISLTVALVLMISTSRLICPGCFNRIDEYNFGRYCPECGAQSLRPGAGFRTCGSCSKYMDRGRWGRLYKIRACTHCGLMLNEEGLWPHWLSATLLTLKYTEYPILFFL